MRPDTAPSVLIDAKTLARDYLSVSLATVWRMRADGKLPEPIRLTSQCLRWNRDVVLAWIDAGCPPLNQQGRELDGGSKL